MKIKYTMRKTSNKAQSTIEYAFLVISIIGAVAIMAVFGQRAVAGFFQRSANSISEKHFSPEKDNWAVTISGDSRRRSETIMNRETGEDGDTTGWQSYTRDIIYYDRQSKDGTE